MNGPLPRAILSQLKLSDNRLPEAPRWLSFHRKEWERTLAWLDTSGLTLYFRHRLEAARRLDELPQHAAGRLNRCHQDNSRRSAAISDELRTLNELLNRARVGHLVLKGLALLTDYCPDPALRAQYDHDFLVPQESLETAVKVLVDAGYHQKDSSKAGHPVVLAGPESGVRLKEPWEALYSPHLARCLELHVSLWESDKENIAIDLPQDLFERSAKRCWDDFEFRTLGEEDALVFQVLHAFHHILGNCCRLAIFLEIAYFMKQRSSDSPFWKRFIARIESLQWLPQAAFVVLGLAADLFGAPMPEGVMERLNASSFPALALWSERYGRRSALANFRSDKYTLFLHREFVSDLAAWGRFRQRRLFPVYHPPRVPSFMLMAGFSRPLLRWLYAARRFRFHALGSLKYAWQYPQWKLLRNARVAAAKDS